MLKVMHNFVEKMRSYTYIYRKGLTFSVTKNKCIRLAGFTASILFVVLGFTSIFPIVNNKDEASATPGTPEVPTITMTSANASVDIVPSSSLGTFSSSTIDKQASFTVSTSNYTGYELQITADDDLGLLTNSNTGDTLASVSTATSEADFSANTAEAATNYNGKWGYKPNTFCPDGTVSTCNTNTNYLPAPTTAVSVLNHTTSANPTGTSDTYTISIGARTDYIKSSGTYANTYTLTAVANYVAYAIEYYDLSGIGSSIPNDSGITWTTPDTGSTAKKAVFEKIATQASSTNTGATITLDPKDTSGNPIATPARNTYTFAGWCRNSTDQASIGVNQTVTAMDSNGIRPANATTKVTAYNNPGTMCNGVIPDYNTSTDNYIKAGDTTLKLDPTKDNTNIKLYAVWKPTTFADAGIAANANMQTMTTAICNKTTPNQFTKLKDARGSAANTYVTYAIMKLLDGKCWMADNLDLDVYAYKGNLTTANTHADATSLSYFTGASSQSSTTNRYPTGSINSVGSAYTDPNPVSHTTQDWTTSYNSYTVPLANRHGTCNGSSTGNYPCMGVYKTASYTHTTVINYIDGDTTKPYNIGMGSYRTGTYYNYCAASAGYYCFGDTYGTGNSAYDICPSAWKMPSGDQAVGSYYYLNEQIKKITSAPANATNPLSVQAMLSTPLTGEYNAGIMYRQGAYGIFWSSTRYDTNDYMRYLYISGTVVDFNGYNRYRGVSVRCIAQ